MCIYSPEKHMNTFAEASIISVTLKTCSNKSSNLSSTSNSSLVLSVKLKQRNFLIALFLKT